MTLLIVSYLRIIHHIYLYLRAYIGTRTRAHARLIYALLLFELVPGDVAVRTNLESLQHVPHNCTRNTQSWDAPLRDTPTTYAPTVPQFRGYERGCDRSCPILAALFFAIRSSDTSLCTITAGRAYTAFACCSLDCRPYSVGSTVLKLIAIL